MLVNNTTKEKKKERNYYSSTRNYRLLAFCGSEADVEDRPTDHWKCYHYIPFIETTTPTIFSFTVLLARVQYTRVYWCWVVRN